jgi:hypothetical protein
MANICVYLKYTIGNFWISGILIGYERNRIAPQKMCLKDNVPALLTTCWIIGHSFFMPKYSDF